MLAGLHSLDEAWIYSRIFDDRLEARFESGEWTGDEFMTACEASLGVQLDRARFPAVWSDIFSADTEMALLVDELRQVNDLCLVSNTNVWHYAYVKQHFPVVSAFEHCVLSYEVRCLKPDKHLFKMAKEFANGSVTPVYIDDLVDNVRAAAAVGFHAIHFRDAPSLRRDLAACGVGLPT